MEEEEKWRQAQVEMWQFVSERLAGAAQGGRELCHAATRIQASFRGHMARKQAPKGKPEEDLSRELQKLDAKGNHGHKMRKRISNFLAKKLS
ncbi:neuromodulin [Gryllus bimaculatus]|nr:neuromodulin [Gryllus bimaculatus]